MHTAVILPFFFSKYIQLLKNIFFNLSGQTIDLIISLCYYICAIYVRKIHTLYQFDLFLKRLYLIKLFCIVGIARTFTQTI